MNRSFDYPRLFKWLFFIFLIIMVVALVYSVFLYRDVEKSKKRGMPVTEERVYEETDLVKIEEIDSFYAEQSYHAVSGADKNNHKKIVFVPLNESDKDIVTIDQAEIMSKEKIQNQWKKSCRECKMIKITPGIIDDDIVWELTYRDESDHYVLEFLSISDGKQYERLSFTERFK